MYRKALHGTRGVFYTGVERNGRAVAQQIRKEAPRKEAPRKQKTKQAAGDRLAIDIPEAARRLGIGRNQAYEAAKAGELPTIPFGKRRVVPLVALERLLRADDPKDAA
jgi:excisionase family DNA binding protein